jgi:hypothetical protein
VGTRDQGLMPCTGSTNPDLIGEQPEPFAAPATDREPLSHFACALARAANSGSRRTRTMAWARAWMSSGGTSRPSIWCRITSAGP